MSNRFNRSNIVETAANDGRFKTLVNALVETELDDVLVGNGPFTVFAPLDSAFAGIDLNAITEEQLQDILTYHVVSGYFPASDLRSTLRLKSVQGSPLNIRARNGNITVNGNPVRVADVKASNGVIHVIDTVLMP